MSSSRSRRRFVWAYQIAAVSLLLLTAFPFTASFATWDLGRGVLCSALDENCGDDSIRNSASNETGLLPVLVNLVPDLRPVPAGAARAYFMTPASHAVNGLFQLRL